MFRPIRPTLICAAFALSGCLPAIQIIDRPNTTPPPPSTTTLPDTAVLPPADYVALRLVDGSPGLGLWCDQRSDCINAARILCDNRHSIRAEFDIDASSPGAAQYFNQSRGAPHQVTVSCPV